MILAWESLFLPVSTRFFFQFIHMSYVRVILLTFVAASGK